MLFRSTGQPKLSPEEIVYNDDRDEWQPVGTWMGHTTYQNRRVSSVYHSNGVTYDVFGYQFYEDELDLKYGSGTISRASVRVIDSFPYTHHTTLLPYGGWYHRILDLKAQWRYFWNLY